MSPEKSQPTAFFTCRLCGIELTDFMCSAPAETLGWIADGAILPAGNFTTMPRALSYRQLHARCGANYLGLDGGLIAVEMGDYLLNADAVKGDFAARAFHGCCGFQPRSESNFACANGHHVASVHTDCWLPHFARLWSDRVDLHLV